MSVLLNLTYISSVIQINTHSGYIVDVYKQFFNLFFIVIQLQLSSFISLPVPFKPCSQIYMQQQTQNSQFTIGGKEQS